jgi:hypothetical protein
LDGSSVTAADRSFVATGCMREKGESDE